MAFSDKLLINLRKKILTIFRSLLEFAAKIFGKKPKKPTIGE